MSTNSSKPLRLGVVGAGFIGQLAHLDNFVQLSNCKLVALAEKRDDLRKQVAIKYGFTENYQCHRSMLTDADVDAVIVVTARPHTAEVVADCLRAGKHVLSEKPMAPNLDTAKMLIKLSQNNNVYYCVGYMKRFDRGVQLAKQQLDNLSRTKTLGKLLHVRANCYMGDSYCKASGHIQSELERPEMPRENEIAPTWLKEQEKLHFARYVNVYSHTTNLLQYFLMVTPKVEYFNFLDPRAHVCVLNYGDTLVSLETGEIAQRDWQESIEFIFQSGILKLELPPALLRNVPARVTLESKVGGDMLKTEFKADWSWSFFNQAQQFVDDISAGNKSLIDASYALNDLELIEQIWKQKR